VHCADHLNPVPLSAVARLLLGGVLCAVLALLTACAHAPQGARISTVSEPEPAASSAATPTNPPSAWQGARQYQWQMAQKIAAANPQLTFAGALPDPLASIPVIEVELKADGSIAHLHVLRTPVYHPETVHTAKAAIERAQPFGSVAHLPRPWRFAETFLFNEDLKFQLRTLVEMSAQK
jgi:hypothetical protein